MSPRPGAPARSGRPVRGWTLLCVVGAIVACSNDRAATGGAGSGGASSNASAGVSSPNGSASTGIDPSVCASFCKVAATCFPDCATTRETFLLDPCAAEGEAFLKCATSDWDASTCTAACPTAGSTFEACRSKKSTQECAAPMCAGTATHCGCVAECKGGEERAVCDMTANYADCVCYLNSIPFANCETPIPAQLASPDACEPEVGCCEAAFGTPSNGF